MGIPMKCDKCKAPACSRVVCYRCGKEYHRCAEHGGFNGARRSLRSHETLGCLMVPLAERKAVSK